MDLVKVKSSSTEICIHAQLVKVMAQKWGGVSFVQRTRYLGAMKDPRTQ